MKSKSLSKINSESQNTSSQNVEELSDDELRREVNRLQLEISYAQLTTPNNVDAGQTVTQKALKKMGDSFVSTLAQKSGEAIAKKIVNGILGEEKKKEENKQKNK